MMTKKKTGSLASMKMLLVLPLITLMIIVFSCNKTDQKSDANKAQSTQSESTQPEQNLQTAEEEEIFVVVEQMPHFPGGDAALIKFISENVSYPSEAKENGIQGQVIMRFCVTSEGNIDHVTVARSVSPLLDAEAVRVIESLPRFEPGMQSGKAVNVWFSLPISFKLK